MNSGIESGFDRERRRVVAVLTAVLGLAGLASNELVDLGMPGKVDGLARKLANALQLDARSVAPMFTARGQLQLASHVGQCGEQIAQLQRLSEASLKRVVRAQIEADYSSRAIVDVDGWQLAATEALIIGICARAA